MAGKRGGRGVNAKGRSKRSPPFVMLPHYVLKSAAYCSLKPGPVSLLVQIVLRYNGSNNGQIGFGRRDACKAINVSDKDTVAKYFRELEEKGLVKATKQGGFNMKDPSSRRATEWAITWERLNEQPPTKEFMKWKAQ